MSLLADRLPARTGPRRIALFSCGAASAVAAKIAHKEDSSTMLYNTEIAEEHPDNQRFRYEVERWIGVDVYVWRNDKYNASIYEVFEREKYIKNPHGAACTARLKRSLYEEMFEPGDTMIVGFTSEEQHRLDRLIYGVGIPNDVSVRAPLIERGITKSDCLAMIERAGIDLPKMYRLGFNNNNCIGCVKGGKGYWNKIRVHFPQQFERMRELEMRLGASLFSGDPRTTLTDLLPGQGSDNDPEMSCSIFCAMAESDYNS